MKSIAVIPVINISMTCMEILVTARQFYFEIVFLNQKELDLTITFGPNTLQPSYSNHLIARNGTFRRAEGLFCAKTTNEMRIIETVISEKLCFSFALIWLRLLITNYCCTVLKSICLVVTRRTNQLLSHFEVAGEHQFCTPVLLFYYRGTGAVFFCTGSKCARPKVLVPVISSNTINFTQLTILRNNRVHLSQVGFEICTTQKVTTYLYMKLTAPQARIFVIILHNVKHQRVSVRTNSIGGFYVLHCLQTVYEHGFLTSSAILRFLQPKASPPAISTSSVCTGTV